MANKVRVIASHFLDDGSGKKYFDFAGPSTAAKPVNDLICTGSLFHEVDTKKIYGYIEDADSGEEWVEQIQLGGDS